MDVPTSSRLIRMKQEHLVVCIISVNLVVFYNWVDIINFIHVGIYVMDDYFGLEVYFNHVVYIFF